LTFAKNSRDLVSKSHFLVQGWPAFGLKKPLCGQGNRKFSASKSHFFGQAFGGVSRGLNEYNASPPPNIHHPAI
jgi:hypothetical protein